MSSEQALGLGWAEALHPDDRRRVVDEWQAVAAAGGPFETECRMQTPGRHRRWVTASAVPIRDETDTVSGFLGTVVDVTERKRSDRYHAIQYAISKAMADSTGYEDAVGRMIAALGEQHGLGPGGLLADRDGAGLDRPRSAGRCRCCAAPTPGRLPGLPPTSS